MILNKRLEEIRKKINPAAAMAGTNPADVRIVCVTKYAEIQDVIDIIKLGYYDIAENYLQSINKKRLQLQIALSPAQFDQINWHFIGHLQTNKAALVMQFAQLIQSVDSLRLASKINQIAAQSDKKIDILMQLNISDEKSKFGIGFSEAEKLFQELLKFSHLNLKGLMGIGSLVQDPEASRSGFKRLKLCFDKMNAYLSEREYPRMPILSMGMSNDYIVALQEGSNMIRIGSAIFGG